MRYVLVLLALGLLALPVLADDANASTNVTDNATLNTTDNSTLNVTTNVTTNVSDNGTVNLSDLNLTDTAGLLATCSGNESASVGALPGDFMYGFKRFFENVDKFFTFSPSDAAVKHAKYGHERAVEAHLMACRAHDQEQAGNSTQANETISAMQQLVADQNKEMNESETDLETAISQGSASNQTIAQVDNYTRNSIAVLQSVYERAPEAAKDGLLNALNNSIENYQKHQEKVKEEESKHGQGNVTGNETGNGTQSNETGDQAGRGRGRGDDNSSNATGSEGNLTGGHGRGDDAGSNETVGVNTTANSSDGGIGRGDSHGRGD